MEEELTNEEEIRMIGFYRVSGDCVCSQCGKLYYDHKPYKPSGKMNRGIPWLNELCNGDLVKL